MPRTREYVVQGNYGQGWEDLTFCETRQEAKGERDTYDANETQYPHRYVARFSEAE